MRRQCLRHHGYLLVRPWHNSAGTRSPHVNTIPSLRRIGGLVGRHRSEYPETCYRGATVNLIADLAPSIKIDELHYRMLLPRRIVTDAGLRFYRASIEV